MAIHVIFTVIFNSERRRPDIKSLDQFKGNLRNVEDDNVPQLKKIIFQPANAFTAMGKGYFIGILTFEDVTLDALTSSTDTTPSKLSKTLDDIFEPIDGRFHYRVWKLNSNGSNEEINRIMSGVTKRSPRNPNFFSETDNYEPNRADGTHPRFANLELEDSDGNEIIVQPHFTNGSGGKN